MNLGIRAILYSARKWKKTLLVFCLFLAITTLVLSGLAIADAQEEQAEEVRGTTGASFTVERDISTGGWNGNYSTQEFMSEDMIQQIAAVDGISGYDATLITLPRIFNDKGEELAHENYSFYNYGSYNSQYHELFLSGRFELVEGTHITDDMTGSIIISRELAEWNGLKVGDTLTGVYYPENNTPEVDMKIVGIFDVVADKNDQVNMYDDASYYAYSSYVFCSMDAAEGLIKGWGEDGEGISEAYYYVTDAAQLENVIREVQSISSINWNNYKITANDEVYQNISSALSDTGTLITTLIIVITAVSMVLIILILSMSIRSRKRETGILLVVYASLSAVAGALLRAYQEQGVLHPFLIGHCHPVAEGARHPGIVPYHYCGYGGGAAVSGKFLLPLVHFLFLCAVDEYCGQGLFVFPADEYGRHDERFVRGHPQAFEVYGQVYVEASVRKGELLSGDEHFSPVEFLCTS